MIARSFLFVPADSERKLAKAAASRADALILDLEDSVAADNRHAARALVRDYLTGAAGGAPAPWVRINPVGTPECEEDLDAVIAARPAGLVVPKPDSPGVVAALDREISALEDKYGLPARGIAVMPIAGETPRAVTTLLDYRDPPPRLTALTWGAEDLSAALGAISNRDETGGLALTYRMVRSLVLIAAAAAGVAAIETLHADFRDPEGLTRMARRAQSEGFGGMLAIHPDQVDIINEAFTPSADDVARARRVVEAFAAGAGAVALDGKMLDRPHLRQAEHILARDALLRAQKNAVRGAAD